MLEIPEAVTVATQLSQAMRGRTISGVEVLRSPHRFAFFTADPSSYPERLQGNELLGAGAHGGLIFIEFTSETVILGDGAFPKYTPPGERAPQKHQLRLDFDDGSTLTIGVQMYGGIHLLGEKNTYIDLAVERPSPLTPAFDSSWVVGLWADEGVDKLSAKAFLATGQRIPGLGNGVLQDILWNAQVNPRTKVGELSRTERDNLMASVQSTLAIMTELQGRDTERDLFGRPGGYETKMSRKGMVSPCPRCGGTVAKAQYLGGAIYVCAKCQPIR